MANQNLLPIGTSLCNGKYTIKEHLASGGFGNTYIAVDTAFDETVAIKELYIKGICGRDTITNDVAITLAENKQTFESQQDKFRKEARRLRKLHNPHIVKVRDLFDENGTSYYVMDLIKGESLSQRVKRTGQPIGESDIMNILPQILDALDVVHRERIWHLDLKPANIMIDTNGCVTLIDFGASKQFRTFDGGTLSTSSTMAYTPGFASSEQMEQNIEKFGPWTDLYSLGATIYHLLTLNQPPSPSDINENPTEALKLPSNISKGIAELVLWLMKPNRTLRPQKASDVSKYLDGMALQRNSTDEKENIEEDDTILINAQDKENSLSQDNQSLGILSSVFYVIKKIFTVILYIVNGISLFWGVCCIISPVLMIGWILCLPNRAEIITRICEGKNNDFLLSLGFWMIVDIIVLTIWIIQYCKSRTDKLLDKAEKAYNEQNYGEAVKWYRKAAKKGNAAAQIWLGYCYENGQGVEQNYEEAVKWYQKAAEQGDVVAQNNLGICCENGQGVEKNYEEAVKWYRKAAEQGCATAQNNLGNCYKYGKGIKQSYKEAIKWYCIAAEQGSIDAQNNLDNCYKYGKGIELCDEEVVKCYRKAAEQGMAEAQYYLGYCYYYGSGVKQSYEEAVKWWQKAAEQGIDEAQFYLGCCFDNGSGVEQSYEKAVKWYRKAAEQGISEAQYNLGVLYQEGQGVEQNYREAVKWFIEAAEQGLSESQYNLGFCYQYGKGVEQNYGEAVEWYRKAAEQGYAYAQLCLADCFFYGKGINKDYAKAKDLYLKFIDVVKEGDYYEEAIKRLKEIDSFEK